MRTLAVGFLVNNVTETETLIFKKRARIVYIDGGRVFSMLLSLVIRERERERGEGRERDLYR